MRASTKNFGAMLSTLMFVSCGPAQTPSELASQSEAVSAVADRSGERTGEVQESELASTIVPGPVALSVYLPANYDRGRSEPYPLLLMLHGGGGSNKDISRLTPWLDKAINDGLIPPLVAVMPAAKRSFYLDTFDGSEKWETFIVEELIAHMRESYNVAASREGTLITGISMGGMGSIRLALKHPDRFAAVASMEPAIEPALAWKDVQLRDRFYRGDALRAKLFGDPVNEAHWAANNPATIAKEAPESLIDLAIYLEAGDQDMLYLHHGTELLHRILFDAGVSHEYRLVRGGEHVGPSLEPRFLDAMEFLGRVLDPPPWTTTRAVTRVRAFMDRQKKRAGYPVVPHDPRRLRTK